MGMKLKSGADLCGFELSRFCVQNDVAIPDAPASGRKYFHTGTGMEGKYSLLGRERIYTGTAWRSAAYVDDLANLDITSNADYLALKERVDAFLDGEVDSNGVLDNLKEIQKFLDNYSSATDLTDILNTKLDKTGGTISGGSGALEIKRNGPYLSSIKFSNTDRKLGELGFVWANNPAFFHTDGNYYTLLHSGNVGDYALKTDGSNAMTSNLRLNGGYLRFLSADGSTEYGAYNVNAGNNAPIYLYNGAWKTIAFTDSNVASATKLQTARTIWGRPFDGTNDVSGSLAGVTQITINNSSYGIYQGNALTANLTSNDIGYYALIHYFAGNVLIGTTEDNGAKLQVNGKAHIKNQLYGLGSYGGASFEFGLRANEAVSVERFDSAGNWLGYGLILTTDGKVAVNRISPKATFHVGGSIVADSTIACKGVAAEGSAPVGTVDKWAGSIAIGTKTQTYTHGLGTTDITVAIYEKNGSEWVQILTDIDIVNANTIRVTFGSSTTYEHRIVVMG